MDDDVIDDDEIACPVCGHAPTRVRPCTAIWCDDGWVDETEYDPNEGDPEVRCDTCWGLGLERWCPACGADISRIWHERGAETRAAMRTNEEPYAP
jgi:hypothetical protein